MNLLFRKFKIFYKTSFLPWILPVCMSVHPRVNNFLELSTCFISLRALVFCPHSRQVWSGFGGLKISGPSQASHFRAYNQKSLTDVFTQWVGCTQQSKYKNSKKYLNPASHLLVIYTVSTLTWYFISVLSPSSHGWQRHLKKYCSRSISCLLNLGILLKWGPRKERNLT